MLDYKAKKNYVNQIMNNARIKFYQDVIEENNTDQRKLFTVAKKLCSIKATKGLSFLHASTS